VWGCHLPCSVFLENIPCPISLPAIYLAAVSSLTQEFLLVSGNGLFRTLGFGWQEGFNLRPLGVLD